MRIAIFSDVHSNYHALEAVLSDMANRSVDRLICLGDVTMKGPLPKACVDRVRDLGCPVLLGNTDLCYHPDFHPSQFPPQNQSQVQAREDFARHEAALPEEDREWLSTLPLTHVEILDSIRMDFFHATPTSNYALTMPWAPNDQVAALRLSDETRVSAFGHSHRAFIRFPQGRLVMNVGSVGIPFDGDSRPSYGLVEVVNQSVTAAIVRVSYDSEPAIQAAQDVGMIGWELFAHTARTGLFPG